MKKLMLFLLSGIVIFSSCKKDKSPDPSQPQILNQTDNFTFSVKNMNNVTRVLEYTWVNNGTQASITQATNLQGGTVVLKVYDATNTELYSNSIDNNGSFITASGTPGTWKIKVILTNYSGSVDFTAQKKI